MKFGVNADTLFKTLDSLKDVCAKNDHRPALMGVELLVRDNTLTATATDGFVVVQKAVPVLDTDAGTCVVAPGALLKALKGEKARTTFELDGDCLCFSTSTGAYRVKNCAACGFVQHDKLWQDPENTHAVYCNADFAAKTLKALGGSSNVIKMTLDVKNKLAPIHFTGEAGSRALLMPCRPGKEETA